ncbi:MAG TPA: hypothetical protein VMV21_13900, partial [Vicinamibacteria bacterium]|nr:hypothetical protein [Vicinamibacteria bacterium]
AVTKRGPGADSGAVRTAGGDVYAGRDGNVYKRQDGGGWQKYDNGGNWGNADRPTPQGDRAGAAAGPTASTTATRDRSSVSGPPAPRGNVTMDQLDRDSRARSEGAQRTRDYGSYQGSSGNRGSSGSYRSSGGSRGGSRGGGGRRR